MPETKPPACIVLTTAANAEEANRLGRILVEERLAACATVIPSVQSIYHWQGHLETAPETLLLLKTVPDRLPALEARVHELHRYQIPEFLVIDITNGSGDYLDWLRTSVKPT